MASNIPSNPFEEGKSVSAGVLNTMADVARSIQNVAGGSGVTANLLNGQLSITGLKNRQSSTTTNTVVYVYNNSTEDIEYGESISFEGESMYDTFSRNLVAPSNVKGSPTDFSDDCAKHKAGNWGIALEQIKAKGSGKVCTSGCCLARVYSPAEYEDMFELGWKYVSETDGENHLQLRPEINRGEVLWYDFDGTEGSESNDGSNDGTCWAIINFPIAPLTDLKVVTMSDLSLDYSDGPHMVMVDTDDGVEHATVAKADIDAPVELLSIDTDLAVDDYLVVNKKVLIAQPKDTETAIPIGCSVNVKFLQTDVYQGLPGYRTITWNSGDERYDDTATMYLIPDNQPVLAKATADAGATTVTVQACDYAGTAISNTTYTVKVLPE